MSDVRVKHLYMALKDINDWSGAVMKALGSLDPETEVPLGEDRCAPFLDLGPVPPLPPPNRGFCWPKLSWTSSDPFESS